MLYRDHLTYWRSTLQGQSLPIHENDPQEGWYRTRPRRGFRSLPVRIWRDEATGELLALRDGKRIDPGEVWTWCCMNPVSVEAYEVVVERGEPWPDEIGAGAPGSAGRGDPQRPSHRRAVRLDRSVAPRPFNATLIDRVSGANTSIASDGLPVGSPSRGGRSSARGLDHSIPSGSDHCKPGHNSHHALMSVDYQQDDAVLVVDQGATAPSQALADEIALLWTEAMGWLEKVGAIADQVTADRCANFADAFACLEKQAEDLRTNAKKPVLEEGRAIDAEWKPIVAAADEAKRTCKKALEPFLIAETERIERDAGILGLALEGAKAGTFGRTVSLRRVKRARVSDRSAFIAHYHRDPRLFAEEAVQKLLLKLAEIDLQAGQSIPGAEMVEEKVAA